MKTEPGSRRGSTRLIALLILIFAGTPANGSHDDFDDLIQVHLLGRRLVAVRGEGAVTYKDLQLDEEIVWHGYRGEVGAVVTNRRVLAIASRSSRSSASTASTSGCSSV